MSTLQIVPLFSFLDTVHVLGLADCCTNASGADLQANRLTIPTRN